MRLQPTLGRLGSTDAMKLWTCALCLAAAVPLAAQTAGAGRPPGARVVGETGSNHDAENPRDAYRRRLREHRPRGADAHYEMARWCVERGLDDAMRTHVNGALRRDPDHGPTRALLGQRKVRGRWLPEDEARRALGFLRFEGRWRLPREIEYLRHARAGRAAAARRAESPGGAEGAADLQTTIQDLHLRLIGPSDADRDRARAELVALAGELGDPALMQWTEEAFRAWRHAWAHHRETSREVPVGILSLNLQKVDLLGIDTVPVGFGVGTPGRLQLPRTRSISIGTTVAVPLSTGR